MAPIQTRPLIPTRDGVVERVASTAVTSICAKVNKQAKSTWPNYNDDLVTEVLVISVNILTGNITHKMSSNGEHFMFFFMLKNFSHF